MANSPGNKDLKWLWLGAILEMVGLAMGALSVVFFHQLVMLVYFSIGIPLVLLGMGCYLVVVWREMTRAGAL